MIREIFRQCPSCGYLYASYVHYTQGESPDEVHCDECGFDWQQRRGVRSPHGDAEEYRLAQKALEEEATAHRGLRDEAIAYRDPEDKEYWRNNDI